MFSLYLTGKILSCNFYPEAVYFECKFWVHGLPLKVKAALRASSSIRPALISAFCRMKRLGVFLLPPGWDASPSQGYPQHYSPVFIYGPPLLSFKTYLVGLREEELIFCSVAL